LFANVLASAGRSTELVEIKLIELEVRNNGSVWVDKLKLRHEIVELTTIEAINFQFVSDYSASA
jgi:hypothetical protein